MFIRYPGHQKQLDSEVLKLVWQKQLKNNSKKCHFSNNWEIVWVALLSLAALQLFFGLSLSNSVITTETESGGVSSFTDNSFTDHNTEVPVGPETRQFRQERVEE